MHHELMREFHWTWQEIERTPMLVRVVHWNILQVRNTIEQERIEAERREADAARR